MNRFRTKKRAKDDLSAGRTSEESEQSSLSFFRKGKKTQQEEVKKEFDLATALPSNDDFRTSLLMANLSARFSMLREQDDPNTKIGKASDDSVLHPKRQSRLADFGFGGNAGGLSDIAEVESVRGSNFLRTTSMASEDHEGANGASVINRSRPTEGNNLFGGRQKIYKIPANSGGGLTGRALYDDDVALSSFQRWRQAEKEKENALEGQMESDEAQEETEQPRYESPPPMGYNRKRETSSTTSSASGVARNSTAATSITSQSTSKDGQSAPASAVNSPILERSGTRTRRLYEQGPGQDKHEQSGSVLARIESLNRQRAFGTRTPELSHPTSRVEGSADRFASNRALFSKASAPNLRSVSPAAAGRSAAGPDAGSKMQSNFKPNLEGLPPLSPPVSETGEQPIAKDTARSTLGIFQKPTQPYNESQYVQRQLQLQQGRETPTQRHRAESQDTPGPRPDVQETKLAAVETQPSVQDTRMPPTPATDAEPPQSTAVNLAGLTMSLELNVERPSDKDHPAFRQSAMPTPLSIGAKFPREPAPSAAPKISVQNSQQLSPEDSPTLGPAAGLSGLVRAHLRTESVDSTLDGAGTDLSGPGSRFNLDSSRPSADSGSGEDQHPSSDLDWIRAHYGNSLEPTLARGDSQSKREPSDSKTPDRTSTVTEEETDEFANQLADARRRVREKLTSYVESDSSRATSPLLLPVESPNLTAQSSNPLGILKPKTSRGSLIDRSRNMVSAQSKGLKILGLGGSIGTPPQPAKQSFEDKEFPSLETMKEEIREDAHRDSGSSEARMSAESDSPRDRDEESNTHPGLRAFRQARRELQRRKELETLARHQASQTSQSSDQPLDQPNGICRKDRGPGERTPSRERRPPPVSYRQRPPGDEHNYNLPNGARPSGERSRSGSETSGTRSSSRPPRLRTNTNGGPHDQLGPPNLGRPMMRSPNLPGAEVKGSPMMPHYPYQGRGGPSPAPSPHLERSRSATNLAAHSGRQGFDPHSGQPSPISPMGLPSPAPFAMGPPGSPAGPPSSLGPRPRGPSASQSPGMGPSNGGMPGFLKRPVDKKDISDPTFVMASARVPTTTLPHNPAHHPPHPQYPPPPHQHPPMVPGMVDRPYGGTRSRSNSSAAGPAPPPPVPPINPRRRRDDSRTREPYHSAASPEYEDNRGYQEENGGHRSDGRRRLQKPRPENMQGPGPRSPYPPMSRDNSPPYMAKGNRANGTGMDVPGGMI
ncbi:hypothetical protein VTI74DRAFT_10606 [Chaetomium olivicolor]